MLRRHCNEFLLSVFLVVISLLPLTSATLSVTATFNQSGISGTISFTQEAPDEDTIINVDLTGKGEREGGGGGRVANRLIELKREDC